MVRAQGLWWTLLLCCCLAAVAGAPGTAGAPALPAETKVTPGPQTPWRRTYRLDAPEPVTLALHQFQFAGWGATVDGRPAETRAAGPLGLVSATVPPGAHEVTFAFANTPPRDLGAAGKDIFVMIILIAVAARAEAIVNWGQSLL